jgi:hypothetical protein
MATANPETIQRLMEHLVAAFEEFATDEVLRVPDGLTYLDALMGCHNFMKAIILDLEERTGTTLIRQVAIATLIEGLRVEKK